MVGFGRAIAGKIGVEGIYTEAAMGYDWTGSRRRQKAIAIWTATVTVLVLGSIAAVPLTKMM